MTAAAGAFTGRPATPASSFRPCGWLRVLLVPAFALLCMVAIAGCASAGPPVAQEAPAGCKPVKYLGNFIEIKVLVEGEGRQCLVQDLVQRSAISVSEGFRERGQPSVVVEFFRAHDTDLDLQQHLVSLHPFKNGTGISMNESGVSISRAGALPHHLSVRNGEVRTPGPLGVGVYLGFHKDFALTTDLYARAYDPLPEDQHPMSDQRPFDPDKKIGFINPWNYRPETHFLVDHLHIQSGGRGVIMVGAHNVLRNSVIEVDSDTAAYLYGPGSIVEGNTFIVHLDPAHPSTLPAALKLRDADGAVIRNNRFIVEAGNGKMAEAAINLLASKHVVLEGNRIENTRQLVRADAQSTTVGPDASNR